MCHYSAQVGIKTKKAKVGMELTTRKWGNLDVGLAISKASNVAICIPNGATLIVTGVPKKIRTRLGIGEVVTARFMDQHMKPGSAMLNYYDCCIVDDETKFFTLRDLGPGVTVSVEALPGTPAYTIKSVGEKALATAGAFALICLSLGFLT